jgi:hypothetical protein
MREHLLPESLSGVANRLAEQLGLAREVVLEGTGCHSRALGDPAGRGIRVTLLHDRFDRRIK